jgi:hypothetical protein
LYFSPAAGCSRSNKEARKRSNTAKKQHGYQIHQQQLRDRTTELFTRMKSAPYLLAHSDFAPGVAECESTVAADATHVAQTARAVTSDRAADRGSDPVAFDCKKIDETQQTKL